MTFLRRAVVLALLLGVCGVAPCLAQIAATTTRPVLSPPEMEDFLERCERALFEGMRALTAPALTDAMGKILTKQEIDALLARRDVLVTLFNGKIAQRSEAAVLYTLAR